jgi:hypothetical protein
LALYAKNCAVVNGATTMYKSYDTFNKFSIVTNIVDLNGGGH